ncbi:MAG: dTDP-4-amino-4,6-dideoxygalactose transaminase [Flavobacteriaceae bacterium]|jgi:dTDP-4-amino-4,6-dideoxygalactose transaminase
MHKIGFNKPHLTGRETDYIYDAVSTGKISGNGKYTKLCQSFFEDNYKIKKALLTTSCTDALEMAAILINIEPGDEVIIPSYTFVSTANAFVLRGAKIVFADSYENNPNIDTTKIEGLITSKTKAIVPVHYAGVACDMDLIMDIANRHNLFVIEDAAQAIDSYYKGEPLGSIGHLATFSFHETKNIQCGEGGALAINDKQFIERAEIIWEKGTNRAAFWRGEVDKYNWVDIGSSFLPSEINTAFLYSQLEGLETIQNRRKSIWKQYYKGLDKLIELGIGLPYIPEYATNNAHMFYLIFRSEKERSKLIEHLKKNKISAVFHYICLHDSPYYKEKHDGREMPIAKRYENCLLRLPLWVDMNDKEVDLIIHNILKFYKIL